MKTGTVDNAGKKGEQTRRRVERDVRWAEDMRKARANCLIYLGEGGGTRGHQNLTHAVMEALH